MSGGACHIVIDATRSMRESTDPKLADSAISATFCNEAIYKTLAPKSWELSEALSASPRTPEQRQYLNETLESLVPDPPP